MDTFINNLLKFLKQALSKKPTGCGSPPLPRQSPLDTSVPLKVQKPEVPTTIKELDIDPVTSLGSLDSYTEQTIIANALQSIKQMKQSLSTAGPHKKLRSAPEPYIANSDIEISKQMGIPIPMLMAFRSIEENPRQGSSFLIMVNLFHNLTKRKFIDDPTIGYLRTGKNKANREDCLKIMESRYKEG